MKKLSAIIFSFALFLELSAQKNELSLRFGAGYLARQDLTFSPFVHEDVSLFNIGVGYNRIAKTVQWADLYFGSFNPKLIKPYTFGNNEQTYPHQFTRVNLAYGYGAKVKLKDTSACLAIGGFLQSDIQPSTYAFGRTSSFGYFAAFNLGTWVRYTRSIDQKQSIRAQINLPILTWLARSPYLINDDRFIKNTASHNGIKTFAAFVNDGNLQTWNRIQQFEINLLYNYMLNRKWNLGAMYEFQFIHAGLPTNFLSYQHILSVNAGLKF